MTGSATAAYRADIDARSKPFGSDDDAWIIIATLLGQAARARPGVVRAELLGAAVQAARDVVAGHAGASLGAGREWPPPAAASTADLILAIAEDATDAGALHTARAMLSDLLAADDSLAPLERGRLLVRRGLVDGRLGALRDAADQYQEVERLGRVHRSVELRARAYLGLGSLAQMRGNYPEQQQWARRAARLADRAGLRPLSRFAHEALMITHGLQQRFDEALSHAAMAYRASLGNPSSEMQVLHNVAQCLLDAGHPELAGVVFGTLVKQALPLHMALPALGGLAVAAAATGDAARVTWAARQVERLASTSALPYSVASAALECGTALHAIGRTAQAMPLLERASAIAREHGYYEIIIKTEDADARTAAVARRASLGDAAIRFVREVGAGDSGELPGELAIAGPSGSPVD